MCNSVKSLTSLVVFLQCVSTFGKYKPSRVSASHKMKVANVYYIKSSCAVILREILKTHVIGVLMLKKTLIQMLTLVADIQTLKFICTFF